jgi:hypothetical protein
MDLARGSSFEDVIFKGVAQENIQYPLSRMNSHTAS